MKKVVLSILFVGVTLLANAQKNEITAAKNSYMLLAVDNNKPLTDNLKVLTQGLAHTDKAIKNEKSRNVPELWSIRAMLAAKIALIDTLNVNNSIANQKIAEEAIEKGTVIDREGTEKKNFEIAKANIDLALKNRGFMAFRRKDYQATFDNFKEVIKRNPNDTSMYVNVGVIAKELNIFPEVVKNFKKAIELNHAESYGLYIDAITITLNQLKDTTAALTLIEQALTKFPGNETLIGFETDIHIKRGNKDKMQEFLDYYKHAIEIDPNNVGALNKLKSIYLLNNDKVNLKIIQKQIEAIKMADH